MQAVILAAGRGSRLHPITANRSKAMLPILGRPITELVLETLDASGISDFLVVTNPKDNELATFLHRESQFKSSLQLVTQPHPAGMADALRCAAPWISGEFILSSCDNLVSEGDITRLITCWQDEPHPTAVLALMKVPPDRLASTGVVELQDQWVTKIIEKPGMKDAPSRTACLPIYCLPPDILDYLPEVPLSVRGEYEIQDAIQMLIDRQGGVRGIMVDNRLTLTHKSDLLEVNRHFLAIEKNKIHQEPRSIGSHSHLLGPYFIESGVVIGENCKIGPNVYIEHDCRIGDEVLVRDSVVLRGAVIQDGAKITSQLFC